MRRLSTNEAWRIRVSETPILSPDLAALSLESLLCKERAFAIAMACWPLFRRRRRMFWAKMKSNWGYLPSEASYIFSGETKRWINAPLLTQMSNRVPLPVERGQDNRHRLRLQMQRLSSFGRSVFVIIYGAPRKTKTRNCQTARQRRTRNTLNKYHLIWTVSEKS